MELKVGLVAPVGAGSPSKVFKKVIPAAVLILATEPEYSSLQLCFNSSSCLLIWQ